MKGKGRQSFTEELESDLELAPRTRKRRILRGTRPSSDESDNILDGVDKNSKKCLSLLRGTIFDSVVIEILDSKLRTSKKSTYLQNLEKLKSMRNMVIDLVVCE